MSCLSEKHYPEHSIGKLFSTKLAKDLKVLCILLPFDTGRFVYILEGQQVALMVRGILGLWGLTSLPANTDKSNMRRLHCHTSNLE